jgi:hypothetical protein
LAQLRPSRRRFVRWPTWLWVAGTWGWVAQAVLQGDGGLGAPAARAALGATADGLSTEWTPPVPSYRPEPLPVRPPVSPQAAAQVEQLLQRGGEWVALSSELRSVLDQAAVVAGGRAPWRRVVVEGTGERTGGALDLAFAARRRVQPGAADGGFREAHFVIGNGTRSPDGRLERTRRSLDGGAVVVAMVGDFSLHEPTPAQLRALTELVDYARAKTGIIPVELGDASRAPMAAGVLQAAFNGGLPGDPGEAGPRK